MRSSGIPSMALRRCWPSSRPQPIPAATLDIRCTCGVRCMSARSNTAKAIFSAWPSTGLRAHHGCRARRPGAAFARRGRASAGAFAGRSTLRTWARSACATWPFPRACSRSCNGTSGRIFPRCVRWRRRRTACPSSRPRLSVASVSLRKLAGCLGAAARDPRRPGRHRQDPAVAADRRRFPRRLSGRRVVHRARAQSSIRRWCPRRSRRCWACMKTRTTPLARDVVRARRSDASCCWSSTTASIWWMPAPILFDAAASRLAGPSHPRQQPRAAQRCGRDKPMPSPRSRFPTRTARGRRRRARTRFSSSSSARGCGSPLLLSASRTWKGGADLHAPGWNSPRAGARRGPGGCAVRRDHRRTLERPLSVADRGSRTALPRQQTLRALIDWSYDLLGASDKTLFNRLSVFAGGWTWPAAEDVGADHDIRQMPCLDLVSGLAHQSLIVPEGHGARYRMLESIRDYARDRLQERGEAVAVSVRHRDYFVRLAEDAEPHLEGAH